MEAKQIGWRGATLRAWNAGKQRASKGTHRMVKFVLTMTRRQKRLVLLLLDLSCVALAFTVSTVIQFSTLHPAAILAGSWPLVPPLMAVALGLSLVLGTADVRLKHYDLAAAERTALFAAILAVASAALAALGALGLPAGFHVIFGLVFLALAAGGRIGLLHVLLAIYRQSAEVTRVLIYGAGRTGMALAAALRSRADILPVAFVDDNATLRGLIVAGLPVFSGPHLPRVIEQYNVRRVLLAMPSLSVHKQSLLSRRLARLGLEVQTLPAFAQLIGDDALVDKLVPAPPSALLNRKGLHDEMADGFDAVGRDVQDGGDALGVSHFSCVVFGVSCFVLMFPKHETPKTTHEKKGRKGENTGWFSKMFAPLVHQAGTSGAANQQAGFSVSPCNF